MMQVKICLKKNPVTYRYLGKVRKYEIMFAQNSHDYDSMIRKS